MLDVNYLLHRQQVSLIRAASAPSPEIRAVHLGMARAYRDRVDAYRNENRAALFH